MALVLPLTSPCIHFMHSIQNINIRALQITLIVQQHLLHRQSTKRECVSSYIRVSLSSLFSLSYLFSVLFLSSLSLFASVPFFDERRRVTKFSHSLSSFFLFLFILLSFSLFLPFSFLILLLCFFLFFSLSFLSFLFCYCCYCCYCFALPATTGAETVQPRLHFIFLRPLVIAHVGTPASKGIPKRRHFLSFIQLFHITITL